MLIGITTCVNYSMFLKETLPHNIKYFDTLYIITSLKDKDTVQICKPYSNIKVIKTKCFHEKNAPFYKSKAINLVLDTLTKDSNTWCIILDADIKLPEEFRNINFTTLNKENIYTYTRTSGNTLYRNTYILGYFQMFNTASSYYHFNYDLMFRTAQGADIIFSSQWPPRNNIVFDKIKDGEVRHIGKANNDWCSIYNLQDTTNNFLSEVMPFVEDKNKNYNLKELLELYTSQMLYLKFTTFITDINLVQANRRKLRDYNKNLKNLKEVKKQLQSKVHINYFLKLKQNIKNFIHNNTLKASKVKEQITSFEKKLAILEERFNKLNF